MTKMTKSKYDTYLKKVKARTIHKCMLCNEIINPGEFYFRETNVDKFLQSLHAKKFCLKCYDKYGNTLLKIGKRRLKNIQTLDRFLH